MLDKRLKPNEVEAIKRLEAARQILLNEKEYVWDALDGIKRGRMEYGRVLAGVQGLIAKIRALGSEKQNDSLDRNLMNMVFTTGVRRPGQGVQKDWGMWVSNADLAIIIENAREGACLVCDKNKAEQRACKFAKILDTMPVDRMMGEGCGYFYG